MITLEDARKIIAAQYSPAVPLSRRRPARIARGAIKVVGRMWFSMGAPLDPSNRWLQYAVAMSGDAVRRHQEADLYASRLRSRRALVPNYSHDGKVLLSLRP
jgi:hypothetical protein